MKLKIKSNRFHIHHNLLGVSQFFSGPPPTFFQIWNDNNTRGRIRWQKQQQKIRSRTRSTLFWTSHSQSTGQCCSQCSPAIKLQRLWGGSKRCRLIYKIFTFFEIEAQVEFLRVLVSFVEAFVHPFLTLLFLFHFLQPFIHLCSFLF